MSSKTKLDLQNLKVQSFITSQEEKKFAVAGGKSGAICPESYVCRTWNHCTVPPCQTCGFPCIE